MAKYKYTGKPVLFSDSDPARIGETSKFLKKAQPGLSTGFGPSRQGSGFYCQAGAPPAGLEREKHRGYHFDMRVTAISIADPPVAGTVMFNFYLNTSP